MNPTKEISRLWVYQDPHPSGGICTVCLTRQQAIDYARRNLKISSSMSDEEVFEEFIVVHWAFPLDTFDHLTNN